MFEGSIIRVLRRLEEMLNQLKKAAQAIGNEQLYAHFVEGSRCLKRGIVFSGSLYL
jgi:ATP-dependent RNA helicase DOB1